MARNNPEIHYRTPTDNSIRSKSPLIVYFLVAAVVAFMFVFGLASVIHGALTGKSEDTLDKKSQNVAQVASQNASQADGQAATGPEQAGGANAANADSGPLAWRDSDFALDPARTDWNFTAGEEKVVYLTIDDGPSELTSQVLDILDRYNAKATFFVVGQDSDHFPMIAEAYKRGHTIGLHTNTHDYAQVYASTDSYFADLEAVGQVVKDQIGYVPCFIRFPGGSSNSISANYTPGIMSALVEEVQARGYQYYDWNLSVGDGSVHTTEEIVGYGTEPISDTSIMLLCHDSSAKQTTVDALPAIIEHYQSLGYTFKAIDRSTWVCHHGVTN